MPRPALTELEWQTGGANETAPTANYKTGGWGLLGGGKLANSQMMNYWKRRAYNWFSWLSTAFPTEFASYSLTDNTHNADLVGGGSLGDVRTVLVTPSSFWNLTGIVGGVDGRELEIVNVASAIPNIIILNHENASSTAANRIVIPSVYLDSENNAIRIYPGGSVRLRYHGATSRWKLIKCTGCKRRVRVALNHSYGVFNVTGQVHQQRHTDLTFSQTVQFPLGPVLFPGCTLEGWHVWLNKTTDATVTIRTAINFADQNSGSSTQSTSYTNALNAPGITGIPTASNAALCAPDMVGAANGMGEVDAVSGVPSRQFWITVNVSVGTPVSDDLYGVDAVVWMPI